ncbi:hypothetical protein SGR_3580 [Streptomyces griseus subsp. griseus NBRC 13350]|uniref:Uncharacterized protein n=1 Tax=Streptomyces griseus subsp. griseus (strain JCM 4626 / CBS 651.72 / NBRC 13350 / KCC S-0626 / ISP 5235) TaxID=455632 RepID=B1VP30_STRGG|nr:hypothetical protein SGR_3580 [Streptomyces griseus subsp. griseus NBRC 13350]
MHKKHQVKVPILPRRIGAFLVSSHFFSHALLILIARSSEQFVQLLASGPE